MTATASVPNPSASQKDVMKTYMLHWLQLDGTYSNVKETGLTCRYACLCHPYL